MSDYSSYTVIEPDLRLPFEKKRLEAFLSSNGLRYEHLDYVAEIVDEADEEEHILACGGYEGNTIECVAVSPELRGEGLMDKIVSHLERRLLGRQIEKIRVFTKPENLSLFESEGFTLIGRGDKAIFLEHGRPDANDYSASLAKYRREGKNGCIVMNANPFTLGHRYLVEKASKEVDNLYIFVVEEDRSVFPYKVRKRLVEEGTADIPNVTVLDGGPYIISNSTFPSYFLKEYSDKTKTHAQIDLGIFAKYVAPPLGITVRFAGSEENDEVTRVYNETMKEVLPFDVRVIPRKESDGRQISASFVRKKAAEGDLAALKNTVPESTYSFLCSDEGKTIVSKLKDQVPKQ